MPLIKDGLVIEDAWTRVEDCGVLPDGPVVVSLARWQAERDALLQRNGPLGIVLASNEMPEAIADNLARFDLVCLAFPKFQDGRAYSSARKLRQRFGYRGELRAVGNVLRDQFLFMRRCGFDSFEVADARAVAQWQRAMSEISVVYQPAADARATATQQRAGCRG